VNEGLTPTEVHETAEETEAESSDSEKRKMDPARRITLVVLAVVAVLFGWHVLADRATPYTDLAKVDGYVVPIAAQVPGYVTEVGVVLNEAVEEGDLLVRINPVPYQLAVNSARAQLELSGQQVEAQTSAIESAAGRLGVQRAQLDRSQRYYNRVSAIADRNPGALSQADIDRATTQLASAEAAVLSAEAELERARATLGVEGQDNPAIRAAAAALEQAEFDLENTEIRAPGPGIVGDLQLAEGHFAAAGQPLATFISAQDVWVRADMRENNLGRMEVGNPAEIALDVAPGRVFRGYVASLSAGVSTGQQARGDLPTAEQAQGWLQDPQRFPIVVRFEGEEARGLRRAGGRASVIVYTGSNPLLNLAGKARIRLTALFSYLR
ncbi:MAG: HlyD family secretion protein, partial [marine benthic group bacterium]|jgi:multidrug resistance efflux pump|nr:HlyD family secretion protein [Gemmatimonadota bacterium]